MDARLRRVHVLLALPVPPTFGLLFRFLDSCCEDRLDVDIRERFGAVEAAVCLLEPRNSIFPEFLLELCCSQFGRECEAQLCASAPSVRSSIVLSWMRQSALKAGAVTAAASRITAVWSSCCPHRPACVVSAMHSCAGGSGGADLKKKEVCKDENAVATSVPSPSRWRKLSGVLISRQI